MIAAVYLSYVVPLIFLLLVSKGEARGLILAFAWGMSSALAVFGFSEIFQMTTVSLSVQLSLVFPALEELLKILPLFFIMKKFNRKNKYTIVRYALAMGIGFSILENYLYLSFLMATDTALPLVYALLRSLTASLLHGSCSALIGYGFQQMLNLKQFSFSLIAALLLTAVGIHGLYNVLWLTENGAIIAFFLPPVFFYVLYAGFRIFRL